MDHHVDNWANADAAGNYRRCDEETFGQKPGRKKLQTISRGRCCLLRQTHHDERPRNIVSLSLIHMPDEVDHNGRDSYRREPLKETHNHAGDDGIVRGCSPNPRHAERLAMAPPTDTFRALNEREWRRQEESKDE